jgi:hypothetical protein
MGGLLFIFVWFSSNDWAQHVTNLHSDLFRNCLHLNVVFEKLKVAVRIIAV